MKLSLVVATLGRTQQITQLLESLAAQHFTEFEVIFVDQNMDDRILEVIHARRWHFHIQRIHTPHERGLSRGRNRGWPVAKNEIILFPDDDCWYPPKLFARAIDILENSEIDILAGRACDSTGRSINGTFAGAPQWIARNNIWHTQIEWMVFFKKSALKATGGFDPEIGVGASTPWHSCEGQDIMLRALQAGCKAWFDPSLAGHHAEHDIIHPSKELCDRGRAYARGFGHVMRKHSFSPQYALYWSIRPVYTLLKSIFSGNLPRARYSANVCIGRVEGYLARPGHR